ncbi:uncharacterized protein LOC111636644 [Centruroides sculpturatus]|uniref:uncharacterized protein LOC111636644 n=1 Tax=Centruroides sculpturatus TaxID=218467 RepID=UPI000C6C8B17|nr:uncharacterized protein LOC111636644 [Centruroides sculpturatus]XP_023237694.1 uncharacterized protein LOC111636644 [Centruroides sculpturatus]XP_023237695.1 uncharacterized protein LOC111636644 [Centruroides sculpturatus]
MEHGQLKSTFDKGEKKNSDNGNTSGRKQNNRNFVLTQMASKSLDIPNLTYSVKEQVSRFESFRTEKPTTYMRRSYSAKDIGQISSLSYPGRIQIKREETSKQTPNIIKCSSRTLLNSKEMREKSEQKRDVDVITHTTETSAIHSDAVESKMRTFSLPKILPYFPIFPNLPHSEES